MKTFRKSARLGRGSALLLAMGVLAACSSGTRSAPIGSTAAATPPNDRAGSVSQRLPRTCEGSQLSTTIAGRDSVTSQPFVDVQLRNSGTRLCRLRGYPRISDSTADRASRQLNGLRVRHRVYVWRSERIRPVLLGPGGSAYFTIESATAYDGPVFTIHNLVATLPGTRTRLLIHVDLQASHARHRPTILHVSLLRATAGKPKQQGRQ